MSKRKRTSNIEKWIKEERGIGNGPEYKPWLKIQDVSSQGRSTRLKGIKTKRQHEFLSDMEKYYFYISEFSNCVTDIREQFPLLPIEETILIADELGIEHPKHPKTGEYVVMTTDFVLTVDNGNKRIDIARTVKSNEDLFNERIIQKFEIEREYCSCENGKNTRRSFSSYVTYISKTKSSSSKQRTREDENTKKYYGENDSIRSTADSGGQKLARGPEHQMLYEIQAQGELQDFINVLKLLEQYPQVKVIRAFMNVLPEGSGERKFTKLSDGVTKRRYVIAEIFLMNGKQYNIVEKERGNRSLSMLILSTSTIHNLNSIFNCLLVNLVNDNGTWTSKTLNIIENYGVIVMKAKHSSKGVRHRSEILLSKLV